MTNNITGTAKPKIGGQYTGTANDAYNFQVSGRGPVGVTQGLTLKVTNSAGATVASLNIGGGYSPGSSLTVGNGITVSLGWGP